MPDIFELGMLRQLYVPSAAAAGDWLTETDNDFEAVPPAPMQVIV
jgi:hypothetical protein